MTQRSYFWEGLATGDAVLAPYSHDLWHSLWQIMFSRADNQGVLDGIDDELIVTGVVDGISVAIGKALVDGSLYQTDQPVSITMLTPVINPRIDRIVVQKNWAAQTIRIARVAGTANASPSAPALTQVDLSIWEIPLAQVLITTAGVITVTDERENARTRLANANVGNVLIATFTAEGIEAQIDFLDIPDAYQHLEMYGNILSSVGGGSAARITFNGDGLAENYNRQLFGRFSSGVIDASSALGDLPSVNTIGDEQVDALHSTQFSLRLPNYKDTTFYKTAIQRESVNENNVAADLAITIENFVWLNTDVVNRITITPASGGVLKVGTVVSLYGMN